MYVCPVGAIVYQLPIDWLSKSWMANFTVLTKSRFNEGEISAVSFIIVQLIIFHFNSLVHCIHYLILYYSRNLTYISVRSLRCSRTKATILGYVNVLRATTH